MSTTTPRLLLCATLATLTACGSSTPVSVESSLLSLTASGAVVGGHGKLRLSFSNPLGQAIEVALESSEPTQVQVPATVTIPAGALLADVSYDATTVGSANITATYANITRRSSATVVDAIEANTGGNIRLENGATTSLYLGLNIAVPESFPVPLVVSSSAIAEAPPSVAVPPFASQAIVYVKGKSIGQTTITTSLPGASQTALVTVVDHARIANVSSNRILEVGSTARVTLGLDAVVAHATPISITSSSPAVAAAPAMVVPAGGSFASVDVPIVGAGLTDLTFSLGDSKYTMNLAGVTKARLTRLYAPENMAPGLPGSLTAFLDATTATTREVMLSSNKPSVLSVPDRVLILPNANSGTVSPLALSEGDAIVTATLDGVSLMFAIHVGYRTDVLSIGLRSPKAMVGAVDALNINVGSGYGYDQVADVTLSSSDPSVAAVPAHLPVSYSTSLPIAALKAGTTTITATANGTTTNVVLEVVTAPVVSSFGPNIDLPIGNTQQRYVYLSTLVPTGTPVSFTSSNPAVVAAPPAQVISDSNTYFYFSLTGLISGTAVLTATIGSTVTSAVVYVGGSTPYPSLYNNLSAPALKLQIGAIGYAMISFTNAATEDTPVTIATSAAGIVNLPQTSATMGVGSSSISFPLVAVGAGSVDVTATVLGVKKSITITVVTVPTFSLFLNPTAPVGTLATGVVSSDCVLPANVSFTLASTSSANASVQTSSIILGPEQYTASVTFGISALAAGNTMITAVSGATMLTAPLTVTP